MAELRFRDSARQCHCHPDFRFGPLRAKHVGNGLTMGCDESFAT